MGFFEPIALIVLSFIVYYCLILLKLGRDVDKAKKDQGDRPLKGSDVKYGLLIAEDRIGVEHDESPSSAFYRRLMR